MLDREHAHRIWQDPVINRVRKSRHHITAYFVLHDAPPLWMLQNDCSCLIDCVEELAAESWHPAFVKLRCGDEFCFRFRMIGQSHPIARRAARITSSCVCPLAVPEDNSSSRRAAWRIADSDDVSARPALMLSHNAWAREILSSSGRAIASLASLFEDISGAYPLKNPWSTKRPRRHESAFARSLRSDIVRDRGSLVPQ